MQELLLINPRRRRKARKTARKARRSKRRASPAQIAARKRFAAMARAGSFGKKRRRRKSRARRSNPVISLGGTTMARRRRRSRSRARHRNPISFRGVAARPVQFLKPALIGAVGAITVNTVMSRLVPLMLPANLQAMFMTGRVRYLTQGLAAVGVGMLAQRLGVRAQIAERMAEGSLTVTLTDAIRDLALSAGVPLGGVGYYLPGRNAGAAVPSASGRPGIALSGMSAYIQGPGSVPGNVTPMRRSAGVGGLGFGPGRTF